MNGNFLDIAVLEWCKLFADKKGKQHWSKVIRNSAAFEAGLWGAIGMDACGFETYIEGVMYYRDKFVAHLDNEDVMHIPVMKTAQENLMYLYDYLLANEEYCDCFQDAPPSAMTYFGEQLQLAQTQYTWPTTNSSTGN